MSAEQGIKGLGDVLNDLGLTAEDLQSHETAGQAADQAAAPEATTTDAAADAESEPAVEAPTEQPQAPEFSTEDLQVEQLQGLYAELCKKTIEHFTELLKRISSRQSGVQQVEISNMQHAPWYDLLGKIAIGEASTEDIQAFAAEIIANILKLTPPQSPEVMAQIQAAFVAEMIQQLQAMIPEATDEREEIPAAPQAVPAAPSRAEAPAPDPDDETDDDAEYNFDAVTTGARRRLVDYLRQRGAEVLLIPAMKDVLAPLVAEGHTPSHGFEGLNEFIAALVDGEDIIDAAEAFAATLRDGLQIELAQGAGPVDMDEIEEQIADALLDHVEAILAALDTLVPEIAVPTPERFRQMVQTAEYFQQHRDELVQLIGGHARIENINTAIEEMERGQDAVTVAAIVQLVDDLEAIQDQTNLRYLQAIENFIRACRDYGVQLPGGAQYEDILHETTPVPPAPDREVQAYDHMLDIVRQHGQEIADQVRQARAEQHIGYATTRAVLALIDRINHVPGNTDQNRDRAEALVALLEQVQHAWPHEIMLDGNTLLLVNMLDEISPARREAYELRERSKDDLQNSGLSEEQKRKLDDYGENKDNSKKRWYQYWTMKDAKWIAIGAAGSFAFNHVLTEMGYPV